MVKCPRWLPCPVTLLLAASLPSLSLSSPQQCNTLAGTRGTTCLSAWRFNTLGGISGVLPYCLSLSWSFAGAMHLEVHFVPIAECFPACWYNSNVTLVGVTHMAHCMSPSSLAATLFRLPTAHILHQLTVHTQSSHSTIAQCVHWTVEFPCSPNSPVVATQHS